MATSVMFLAALMLARLFVASLVINSLTVNISALETVDSVAEGVFMCVVSQSVGAH